MSSAPMSKEPRFRVAFLLYAISHFEVPLFRLFAQTKEIQFKVFYLLPVKEKLFDSEYKQQIDWGDDLLAGYDSVKVESAGELDSVAREWGADVALICGYGWPGAWRIILSNWLSGFPQVHRGTLNYFLDPRRPFKGRLMRPLGRLLLRLFNAHHYGGSYSKKVLLAAGAKEESLFFVPYSVDTPHFLAAADHSENIANAQHLRAKLGWKSDDHVILFIGQHNWVKGPDIAMDVFYEWSETDSKARFLIVGSGHMTESMQANVRQHHMSRNVHFAGFVPSAQTVPYYLASNLVICTSRYETWARMINEAMLCRRPCLVSEIVAAAGDLVVNEENGYVVKEAKVEDFVPVIQRYFSLLPEERKSMGESARIKAREFAYEPYISNAISAFRYALRNSKSFRNRKYK